MVPRAGIEPARSGAGHFKCPVSTNSTTVASLYDGFSVIMSMAGPFWQERQAEVETQMSFHCLVPSPQLWCAG